MNKLLIPSTNIGGHPLSLDDLRFLQDALAEAINGSASGFGISLTDTYIISGCVPTPAGLFTFNISEGFIVFNGEVCRVDAHTSTALTLVSARWALAGSVYDVGSSKVYKSGAVYETRQIRKVKLYSGFAAPLGVLYSDTKRLPVKVSELLSGAYAWQQVSFTSPFSDYEAAGVNDSSVKLDKINGLVMMKGRVKRTPSLSHAANVQFATLPDAVYFPSVERYVSGASVGGNFTASRPVTYIIKTDGSLWAKAGTNIFDSGDFYLDGCAYPL